MSRPGAPSAQTQEALEALERLFDRAKVTSGARRSGKTALMRDIETLRAALSPDTCARDDVPPLAVPGDGASLDDRRVDRVRAALAARDGHSDRTKYVDDFEAILAARVPLPTLPSWAHLVAHQPCFDIRCTDCGAAYDENGDYIRHFDSLDDARAALQGELDDDSDWTFVDGDLLCEDCREARESEAGETRG